VIIDFKAEWCLSCKELDQLTFSDPRVIEKGKTFIWLAFDATSPSDKLTELQKKYNIGGLPFVLVYNNKGEQDTSLTLTGFESADQFLKRMEGAFK
jgi:thiol:disulfide interchange protein DsbD